MDTVSEGVLEKIKTIFPSEDVLIHEPMKHHTTFRVGGDADCFLRVTQKEQIVETVKYLNSANIPYFVLGNGSNLLVSDKGYRGVILYLGDYQGIEILGNAVIAKSGTLLSSIAQKVKTEGLTGLEFASGIPGTIGGGVTMNAGAYDGELKDIITSVEVVNTKGEIRSLDQKDLEFGYRTSLIKREPLIVLSVSMSLKKGDISEIESKMSEFAARRRQKQPLEYPSAGSTFKRPEGYFAGKLIMDAGLRGYSLGGAQVSEKHCGFVINKGNAKAADIYELMEEVSERVYNKFQVNLEPEVIMLGEF